MDEDLRFPAQETAACSFTDDTKEAVEFGYQNGEPHVPLKLAVKQEAHAWALPGFDRMAAVHYTITNHGQERLRDVWLGMYANLDSRERSGGSGHLDDAVTMMSDTTVIHDGRRTFVFGPPPSPRTASPRSGDVAGGARRALGSTAHRGPHSWA